MNTWVRNSGGHQIARSVSYTTSFPLTENPISEGGRWQFNSSGVDETAVRTESIGGVHLAHGTQSGHAAPPYDDSSTWFGGWGNDYEVEAVVWLGTNTGSGTYFKEFEILLRWADTFPTYDPGGGFGSTNIRGYEIAVAWNGAYYNLGRYKEATALQDNTNSGFGPITTPSTGDRYRARIQGQRIQMWWNDSPFLDFTDNGANKNVTGNPGQGFWANNVPSNEIGYSSLTIRHF